MEHSYMSRHAVSGSWYGAALEAIAVWKARAEKTEAERDQLRAELEVAKRGKSVWLCWKCGKQHAEYCNACIACGDRVSLRSAEQWADSFRSMRLERDQLRAELAAAKYSTEENAKRLELEKIESDRRAVGLISFIHDEIRRLEESGTGGTHWEGCESTHPKCAAIKRMRAALAGTAAPEPVRVEIPGEYFSRHRRDDDYKSGYNVALEKCVDAIRKAGCIPVRNGREIP